MSNPLRNWIMGYRVCKKYGIRFYPLKRVSYSPASFRVVNDDDYYIWCDIFDKYFMCSFFHELSHVWDYKHTKFCKVSLTVCDKNKLSRLKMKPFEYRRVLKSEVRANRYTISILKATNNYNEDFQKDIEKAMTTYISYLDKSVIADYHYNTIRYLRGEECKKFYCL